MFIKGIKNAMTSSLFLITENNPLSYMALGIKN
jgi:hypothetical protein